MFERIPLLPVRMGHGYKDQNPEPYNPLGVFDYTFGLS